MNRIEQYAADSFAAGTAPTSVEMARYILPEDGARHAMFAPLHYERNYAYPLIVWLHGPKDDERQLMRIMPLVSMRNYVAVAPRGTLEMEGADASGYSWCQTKDHIEVAEHRVLASIQAARERFNIAPARVFLAGLGCGGTMAFRLALNSPRLFAGVMSLCGAFPRGFNPLSRLHEARRLRVLMICGRESRNYPSQIVCDDLKLMYAAGMCVNLRQYPSGDEISAHMLGDLDRWIMEQLSTSTSAGKHRAGHEARGN